MDNLCSHNASSVSESLRLANPKRHLGAGLKWIPKDGRSRPTMWFMQPLESTSIRILR